MNIPLFSVLIANYNNGKYLQEAIDSVLAQTYTNWEVIIVDDKSTDDSQRIYDKYAEDDRFHIFYNEENMGCGYTKARCAELANGEICGFLDPDDTITEDALEVMVKVHVDNPNVSLAYSRLNVMDKDMNFVEVYEAQRDIPNTSSFLEYGIGVSHFVSFKKSLYDKTPGINPYFLRAVDHDLYYLLEEVGTLKFVKKPLYNYRTATDQNISLGENGYKAFLWHLMGEYEACKRRGFSNRKTEELLFRDFKNTLDVCSMERVHEKEIMIRSSKAYRIGHFILKPFKFFK